MGDTAKATGRGFQPDSDVHITLEDQQKINHFARCYAKHDEITTELKGKESELKNIEDAIDELVLLDSKTNIPYLQGEVFMCLKLSECSRALEKEKRKISNDIRELEETCDELKVLLSNLKTQLYAKFGNHINLEDV